MCLLIFHPPKIRFEGPAGRQHHAMEIQSLVKLIGPKCLEPWPQHLIARAQARQLELPCDPMMCQEQTAIARTFNDERFEEWEERRAKAKVKPWIVWVLLHLLGADANDPVVDPWLSQPCAEARRKHGLNFTKLQVLSWKHYREGKSEKFVESSADPELLRVAKETWRFQDALQDVKSCPAALVVAAGILMLFEVTFTYSFGTNMEYEKHFHRMHLYQRQVIDNIQLIKEVMDMFWWPVKETVHMQNRISTWLQERVEKSMPHWDPEEERETTDEAHLQAARDCYVAVLGWVQAWEDWFPYSGTLVALLRHGQRAGALAQGRRDVVDHDVDVMVGVVSEMAWLALRWTINVKLRDRGWDTCFGRTSVDAPNLNSHEYRMAREDLILCTRENPAISLDVGSYIIGGHQVVYAQRQSLQPEDVEVWALATTLRCAWCAQLSAECLAAEAAYGVNFTALQETWLVASELLSPCPAAVLVSSALLMRLEMDVLDAIRTNWEHENLFHRISLYEHAMVDAGNRLQVISDHFWPLSSAWDLHFGGRSLKIEDLKKSTDFMSPGSSGPQITDEAHAQAGREALEDVAAIMSSLGLEWWPCRGTLIALLRHGARSGALAPSLDASRRDVVDHDVDVMVGVPSVAAWSSTLRWLVDAQLRQRGEWGLFEMVEAGYSNLNEKWHCLALPDVVKRQQRGYLTDEPWLHSGLTLEDVEVLRRRAAQLDAEGYMSMTPYFASCDLSKKESKSLWLLILLKLPSLRRRRPSFFACRRSLGEVRGAVTRNCPAQVVAAAEVSSLQESLPESHEVGDAVQAVCPDDGASRPGIIQAANADGSYAVRWLGAGQSTSDVEPREIEQVSGKFALGDAVQVDDQRGKLVAKQADTFTICWEDGSESEISAFEVKPVLIPFEQLEVHRVYHSGAFVDFGAEVMGNLPTAYVLTQDGSRIGKFDPITEHLKRNQKIQVTGHGGHLSTSDGDGDVASSSSSSEDEEDLEEENLILESTWNSGQKSAEYRLKNGVPMQVDFEAKVRVNLASRRSTQLRQVDSTGAAMPGWAPGGRATANEHRSSVQAAAGAAEPPTASGTESEDGDEALERVQEMLPQPVEILQAEKSRQWLLSENHRQCFLRSPRLYGKNKALAETREEQVSMIDYLDACKKHMEAAKMHMEKGKTLYHDAEHAEDEVAFESAGKWFALAIDELNKLHALKDLPPLGGHVDGDLQEEHRTLSCRGFLNLAMCNLKARHFQAALENSEQALSLDASCAKAYYRKAQALEALGKDVEALAVWRQALKHQPEDALIRRKLRAAASTVRTQRSWQRRAAAGACHGTDCGAVERRARAERLQGILDRAAEYVAVDEVRKGELSRICRVFGAGASLDDEIKHLDRLFSECVARKPRHKDLQLSPDEVSFLSSLGVSLPCHSLDLSASRTARQLVERLERGEALRPQEEQFLREQRRLLGVQ
eukprot:s3036_g5.t2